MRHDEAGLQARLVSPQAVRRCAIGTLAALALIAMPIPASAAARPLPDLGPAYPLRLQDVVTRQPLAHEIAGKIVLLSFIAGTCRESCPVIEARFAAVQRLLQQHGYLGSRVHLVLVTVDPVEDTPSRLRSLARRNGAVLTAFHYATGEGTAVRRVLKAYGISVTFHGDSRVDPEHTVAVYLVDPKMRIRYDFSMAYPPSIIARIVERLANETVR